MCFGVEFFGLPRLGGHNIWNQSLTLTMNVCIDISALAIFKEAHGSAIIGNFYKQKAQNSIGWVRYWLISEIFDHKEDGVCRPTTLVRVAWPH